MADVKAEETVNLDQLSSEEFNKIWDKKFKNVSNEVPGAPPSTPQPEPEGEGTPEPSGEAKPEEGEEVQASEPGEASDQTETVETLRKQVKGKQEEINRLRKRAGNEEMIQTLRDEIKDQKRQIDELKEAKKQADVPNIQKISDEDLSQAWRDWSTFRDKALLAGEEEKVFKATTQLDAIRQEERRRDRQANKETVDKETREQKIQKGAQAYLDSIVKLAPDFDKKDTALFKAIEKQFLEFNHPEYWEVFEPQERFYQSALMAILKDPTLIQPTGNRTNALEGVTAKLEEAALSPGAHASPGRAPVDINSLSTEEFNALWDKKFKKK